MTIRHVPDVESVLSGNPTVRDLYAVWTLSPQIPWIEDASLAQRFTAHAIRKEEFLLVLDVSRAALQRVKQVDQDDQTRVVRVRMDYARALMRLGFMREARLELEPCLTPGFQPPLERKMKCDIFLQLGDILREEWLAIKDRAAQIGTARRALSSYQKALHLDPDRLEVLTLTASTAFMLSHLGEDLFQECQETAHHILKVATVSRDSQGPRRRATLAEATAHAILGNAETAALSFQNLQGIEAVSTPDLAEARFQAQFLAEAMGKPRSFFNDAFPPLQLIVFAGHLPDRLGELPRFPPQSIPEVRDALRDKLRSMQARMGLVSAAAGADLLFGEVLLQMEGSLHLVLPWSQEEFRRTSVWPYEPAADRSYWEPLYDSALLRAETIREIGQVYEPGSDIGWKFTMEVTAGIAIHTARALRLDVQPMVLWDGLPGRGAGGTESFYNLWNRKLQLETAVVPLPISPPREVPAVSDAAERGCQRPSLHQEVKTMLFADIVGYSKLTEKVVPEFVATFLNRLGQLTATSKHAPCSVNTWGDAMYAVFDFSRDAGLFSLELAQMVSDGKPDWLAKGLYWETRQENDDLLKHPIDFRIGLHTGPVFMHFDPVVRRLGFTGSHVSRAARIEPVAEPGQVFASEEFVAMTELSAAIQRSAGQSDLTSELGFVCEYAGSLQLAKGYPGRHRIYRVVPRRVFAIESLAKAAHESYFEESLARGENPEINTSLRPWDDLSEDLKSANREQVSDIPNKLRVVGLELTAGGGMRASEIVLTDAQIEDLSIREHNRWMEERKGSGWTWAPVRDNARKLHPLLVPWDQLSELDKEKDRNVVRDVPRLVGKAQFRVKRI